MVLYDYTRYLQLFCIKVKTEVPHCLRTAFAHLKSLFPTHPYFKTLRCDNGLEFVNVETKKILDEFNIAFQLATPYAHE